MKLTSRKHFANIWMQSSPILLLPISTHDVDNKNLWSRISKAILSTVEEHLGLMRHNHKKWISKNTWDLIDKRREIAIMPNSNKKFSASFDGRTAKCKTLSARIMASKLLIKYMSALLPVCTIV